MKQIILSFLVSTCLVSCFYSAAENEMTDRSDLSPDETNGVSLVVLGNVQDAGSPQIACKKECCVNLFTHPDPTRKVVSLGLIDHAENATYLFEATPDMPSQMENLNRHADVDLGKTPNAVFLTHAHIGHYTGLMYFGREAMHAAKVPVYAMPKMKSFLENNGPWSQLVVNDNIKLETLRAADSFGFGNQISITPLLVPHRDEYSETVGYVISGPNKTALFIPDIDKWDKWEKNIVKMIEKVDYAFLDATFYDAEELNNRDISEIPHPFVIESMEKFSDMSAMNKKKVHFIHFNHTNPLLDSESEQSAKVEKAGFNIAKYDMVIQL